MGTTELLWTAIPRGISDQGLLLNAHVDFHLRTQTAGQDEPLSGFPLVASWPPALTFDVKIGQGGATATIGGVGMAPRASREHWADTFPPTTTVRDFRPRDLRNRKIHTMPASKITSTIQSIYQEAFPLGMDQLPPLTELRQVGDLAMTSFRNSPRKDDPTVDQGPGSGGERWRSGQAQLAQALSAAGVVDTTQPSDTAFDFFQLLDYYRPVRDQDAFEKPLEATTFTFQEVLAGLNAEPELQRVLGLVFELNPIPLATLTAAGIVSGTVDVALAHSKTGPQLTATTAISPTTKSTLDVGPRRFLPLPRDPVNGPLRDGYLRLDDPARFAVSQCDPTDGIKLSNAAGSMQEEQVQLPQRTQQDQGLPPLRSGLFVSQNAAAKEMKAKIDATPSTPSDLGNAILYADDLMRGFVTDIWVRGTWRQESMRSSTYTFPTQGVIGPFDEEGAIGRGATQPIDEPDSLNIGEVIYPWEGTPLGVTVGKVLTADPHSSAVTDKPVNPSASPDTPIEIRHGLPAKRGQFTRMIAGEAYRFRMRVRHLDGTSVPFDQATDAHASPPRLHLRTEPVSHSVLYPARPNVPAEGPNVVVLRGDAGAPPEHPHTDRWVMPSRTTFEQIIRTRVLDVPAPGEPGKTVIDKASYGLLAARDGFLMQTHPQAKPMPGHPGDVFLDPGGPVDIRHLPDPLQDAAAIRLHPTFERSGFADEFPFPDPFPGKTPLRFRLVPHDVEKSPELVGDVINVFVRPGETITGWHAAGVDRAHLDVLALLRWATDDPNLPADLKDQLVNAVDQGRHTAISPPEPLTFVYAVRRPLVTADIQLKTRATRRLGDTFAELRGELTFSRRSTDRVDVDADWTECIDLGRGEDAPTEEARSRRSATTVNIDHSIDNDPERQSLDGQRIEFGDTKHRLLSVGTTATSRYPHHYVQQVTTTLTLSEDHPPDPIIVDTGNPAKGLVPGFTKVTVARTSMAGRPVEEVLKAIEPRDAGDPTKGTTTGHYTVDHATGTITFLHRDDIAEDLWTPPDGSVATITYLVPPITQVTPRDYELDIPSSARPTAPQVRYVIPTFGWDQSSDGGTTTSTRSGAGLRVYLERPWFSSGCGEQLGVLLWAQNATSILGPDLDLNNPITPYVTQWGVDPLFRASGLPSLYPRVTHFPDRIVEAGPPTYRVDGTPPGSGARLHKVVVAGHDVQYDAEQDCWYADIRIDHGFAYTPFIRLALARYQPSSITSYEIPADVHLSPVQLAEFAQLAPDRFASVTVSTSNPRSLRVSLSGVSPEACRDDVVRSVVQVTIEERRAGQLEEELAWTPVTDPIPLTHSGGDDEGVHAGTIILPERPGAQEWRIVFEEFEAHDMEPSTANGTPGRRGRLVHVDTLVVTAGGSGPGDATTGGGAEGPAPIFQAPQSVPPSLDHLEIYEIEFNPNDFGPGPVIREIDSSLGILELAFTDLQQVQQPSEPGQPGEPIRDPEPGGGRPGGGGGPNDPAGGPGGGGAATSRGQVYKAILEVFCDPGVLRIPAHLAASTSLDLSVQNVDFSEVQVTMPLVDALPIRGGRGPRMYHVEADGRVVDITTEIGGGVIRGVSQTLSPFLVAEVAGVQRLAGSGRVETAAEIASATFEPGVEAVLLATAGNFPDALAAGPLAAGLGSPILLVGGSLPEPTAAEITRLQPAEIIIVGGTAAVPQAVEDQVRARFPDLPVRRLAGPSRFATAVALSREAFPEVAPTVFVATGGAFPDALSGGAAAVRAGASLLLVNTGSIPPETEEELVRLQPERVVVLGGPAAVSPVVADRLAEVTGATVERLAGGDRFETCAAISRSFAPGTPVFIATGGTFPDALAGTPAAGALGAAMLLVRSTSIPGSILEELRRLRPSEITILGGTSAVAAAIQTQLTALMLELTPAG